MQLHSLRQIPAAMGLAAVLAFAAACSGPASSVSPTAPSGIAATSAIQDGSAVSGATGDLIEPCSTVSGALSDSPTDPCEPPCDETVSATNDGDPTIDPCEPPPPPPDDQGCTPGYWKNHADSWPPTGFSPDQTLASVFFSAPSGSLMDALSFGGGSGIDGAKRILFRAAVAALLNASHPDVASPRTAASVIADVNNAVRSNTRDTMLNLATALDQDNNLGCPLN